MKTPHSQAKEMALVIIGAISKQLEPEETNLNWDWADDFMECTVSLEGGHVWDSLKIKFCFMMKEKE